jgi:hypothetical protein
LPPGKERLAFHDPIADAILSYLAKEDIALHSEALNLKSSQVACLNFLFPLRKDLSLARSALRGFLPGLREVTGIEFEYTGPRGVTAWLGEPSGGKRGQYRTSIDAAIFWIGKSKEKHVTLIEWKYTEHGFGSCSAFVGGCPKEKDKCRSLDVARDSDPAQCCLLTTGGDRRSRRYWEHMQAAGISLSGFAAVRGCPFQGPFYQLMRQFLLAAYVRKSAEADQVDVACIGFARNTTLLKVPPRLRSLIPPGRTDIIDAWNAVLQDVLPMRHYTAEQLMVGLHRAGGMDVAWRNYLRERYDV